MKKKLNLKIRNFYSRIFIVFRNKANKDISVVHMLYIYLLKYEVDPELEIKRKCFNL